MSNKKTTPNDLDILRHSASHVMASAVLEMFPEAKFAIGPSIENGFYYDFELPRTLIPEDLEILEEKMRAIIKANHPFERAEISFADALKDFKKANQPYKVELIKDLEKSQETNKPLNQLTIYKSGVFVDLCSGPHLESTGEIPADAFKLTKISGAYWRGDEKNKMLQRIYGVAFGSKNDLKEYLHMIEEAEKRNHVKLGKELRLFSTHIEGPGFPFFHPKGMIVWNELIKYWKEEHTKENYQEISTPIILNRTLWEKSGHWDHYKDNMYFTKIDETDYAVKPMNCPGGILVYKSDMHSYKELPLKLAEIGLVHRHELSGTLNGLFRVRMFRQDDAHIYCMENQIKDEIIKLTKMIERIYKTFGLSYHMELSTRPENSTGTDKIWEQAENALKDALNEMKVDYKLNPGDGAFYGPKIDFHLKDSLERTWQCGTIQVDFSMPERFELEYADKNNEKKRPIMVHRAVYGSLERFIGILLEHTNGRLPLWLAPIQVRILNFTDRNKKYSEKILKQLEEEIPTLRVDSDFASETIPSKVKDAEIMKIPYILVVGDKEEKSGKIAVRNNGKIESIKVDKFVKMIKEEIFSRQ